MRVLLTGAGGFIGAQIAAALRAAGHNVVYGVRAGGSTQIGGGETLACDFTRDVDTAVWLPRLEGIDAVINCAGILRESRAGDFEAVHVCAPMALFRACAQRGIRRVIQISALGQAEDGEFIRSKHRCDAQLSELDLDWVVIRPSVVYSPKASYGGTSLLRAMAALPAVMFMPGEGGQRLQPISADDLGQAIVALLRSSDCRQRIIEAVGPAPVSMESFVGALRRWLGFGQPWVVHVPLSFVKPVAWIGERFGRGPLGLTMYRMLQHGNVGSADAVAVFTQATGVQPKSVEHSFAESPSSVQDRWHARLYFLAPLLRVMLGLLWVWSGVVGFVTPMAEAAESLAALNVPASLSAGLIYSVSALDAALGVMLLLSWRVELAGVLMLLSLLAYTVIIGVAVPSAWWQPFGGLIKNLPLIPAVMIMMVLHRRR